MAYLVKNTRNAYIMYPETVEEALVHFLDQEIPLESGTDLATKFFDSLSDYGLPRQEIHRMKIKRLARPPGSIISE